ncbi:hypothetical protein [Bradyrhizobium zhanjiangense]|uniref:Uncharacterized protein n=1 Tax=Bradyrhizobium zhanjiangense TaxID=1325107 RepID=A0ABY0DLR7_9BRAD|nr:hypothetical protein [Bradyrhizobium zhanjiangense]RXG94080.1 hypothetical protein EAS62_16370 [Bradyrhizobium zhanjiangense]
MLHFLAVVCIAVVAMGGAARGQNDMTSDKLPSLSIIGAYSFSADKAAYARFIRETIDSHDPPNFSEEVKALLRKVGRGDEIRPLTEEDRQDWEDDLRRHMDDAAVFEVLITNPDERFRVSDFVQADPSRPKDYWQVAWDETFLTADGETVIETDYKQRLPAAKKYRVVFVIHFWIPDLPLKSSYGELQPPPMQPLPERLWRLAPYDLPS